MRVIFISALFMFIGSVSIAQNPIITHIYTADPSAHVFNGKVYLYPSHDEDTATTFSMVDWHVFSSEDMVNWTDHGVGFSVDDLTWADDKAWAPDCEYYKGKYYFYYPVETHYIGVAVGDKPEGPFKDPLGKPLLTRTTPGVVADRDFIDPSIFIDDDGTPYLFFGQNFVNVVKLNDDMISFDDSVKVVEGTQEFFEAVWVHKYNGKYYMSYSGRKNGTKIYYAMADNPMGPYEFKGVILDEVNSGTNHHSICEYKGQWYLFYHNADLYLERTPEGDPARRYAPFHRSVCVDYLYYNEDGTIKKVIPTREGVKKVE